MSDNQRSQKPSRIWCCDDEGLERDVFDLGESIFVAGRGLHPSALYEFARRRGPDYEILARLGTDRHGALAITALLPYAGLVDEVAGRALQAAWEAAEDRVVSILAAPYGRKNGRRTLNVRLGKDRGLPQIFSCDARGHLQTGVERGEGEVGVAIRHVPAGCVRIYLVHRQFGWRVGDAIEPAQLPDGRRAVWTILHDGSAHNVIPLTRSGDLAPGSYQFVIRAYQPGWYLADEPSVLPGDVVSDRRFASLVVRIPFRARYGYDNGVALTPEVAGRPLAHRPYFRFVNNFPVGTDVYAALDPDALPPGLVGRRAAIYVIRHKTAAEWGAGSNLQDISGPGMTSAPKIVPIVPGCVNWDTTLVWPNPQTPGSYDVAIDFGNNASDPALFVPDGSLDSPLDMIDGYVRVGFYVTQDPSLPGPYAGSIGIHDYALPSVQVPSTDAGPSPTDTLPVTATCRYPALMNGTDVPFAVGAFPLVIVMHGNSAEESSYLGYDYLLEHLAGHGFVAVSIYAPVGVGIETRARAILHHLEIMAQNNANPGLFSGHIDLTAIAVAGHSRGAEAVVRAARINTAEALGWHILAGVSIAPTDYHHYGDAGVPLLVIYGSNDGDVSGSWPDRTCFDIYDETGRPRSFVFVYGATHDRFNTIWASVEGSVEFLFDITGSDIPNLISLTAHENVAKGYFAAFAQAHLLGRAEQLEYFSTTLKPSLVTGIQIHSSYQVTGVLEVDNFEQLPHDPMSNSLGGGVTDTALSTLSEDHLRSLDSHSPHVTSGGALAWLSTAGTYVSEIPVVDKDVSVFTVLSFRVTQKFGSPQNPANGAQDFHVRLTDRAGKSRAIRCSVFTDIPYPWVRGDADLIKSALKSVRIPLASYAIANLGADDVDLTNIRSVSFEFDAFSTGEIEVDDIEFSQ